MVNILCIFFYFSLYLIIASNANLTYYQRDSEILFAKQREYYKNNRENIKNKCDNLSEDKKNKIRKYQKQWHSNLSEEDAIRRREYEVL